MNSGKKSHFRKLDFYTLLYRGCKCWLNWANGLKYSILPKRACSVEEGENNFFKSTSFFLNWIIKLRKKKDFRESTFLPCSTEYTHFGIIPQYFKAFTKFSGHLHPLWRSVKNKNYWNHFCPEIMDIDDLLPQ